MTRNLSLLVLSISFLTLNCNHPCNARRSEKKAKETNEMVTNTPVVKDSAVVKPTPVGDWTLIKTVCCGRTSKATNYNIADNVKTLHLGEDNKYLIQGKTNTSKNAGSYTYLAESEMGKTMQFGADAPAMLSMYSNDTLVLSWGYMDLQTEVFVRKR